MALPETEFLTMAEFCYRLRFRYPTVLRMIQTGQIKGAFKVGSGKDDRRQRWRIPATELDRLIQEGRRGSRK